LRYAESAILWPAGQPTPTLFYVSGAIAVVVGLIMFYAGVNRFTRYSILVWIIGLLIFLAGVIALIAPGGFIDFERRVFFSQPENVRLLMIYVSGAIRILIGLLLIIAGISRPPASYTVRLE
jgi:uncharacterized membrane protein HdeD (DUF308 family)